MWARHYDKCINCGTVDVKHLARGLCTKCYCKRTEDRSKSRIRKRGAAKKLTRQFLKREYINKQLSLSDIAKSTMCTRQYVLQKLSEYGIPRRKLHQARIIALERGKITMTRRAKSGKTEELILQKRTVNEDFFSSWSKEMAWVLGVVYTDGHIDPGRLENPLRQTSNTTGRLSIGQKEPEMLQKVLRLMNSNAILITTTGGTLIFQINSNKIYRDLTNIGLRPHKSLTVRFPDVPNEYMSHFIRGCWDGDGGIGFYGGQFLARFFCGSLDFIKSLVEHLVAVGLSKRNLHVRYTKRNNPFYSIAFKGQQDLVRLYEFLYRDADSSCYLEKKHELFKRAYTKYHTKAPSL